MELKDVRTGMFVSWIENGKTVTAIVKSVFFESNNFEFATAAYIIKRRRGDSIMKEQEEVEVDGFKMKTDVLAISPDLVAMDFERHAHPMHTFIPVDNNVFICEDEIYENACGKLSSLRCATFDEVNALVAAKGLGDLVYKPFAFRYEKQTEYKHQAGTNIREDTYLHAIEDTQLLEEKADGVANINGAFYAVNIDSYLKNGIIKYQ
jgi:hypothetical protein